MAFALGRCSMARWKRQVTRHKFRAGWRTKKPRSPKVGVAFCGHPFSSGQRRRLGRGTYGGSGCGFNSWVPPGRRVRRDLVELSFLPFLRVFFAAFFLVFFTWSLRLVALPYGAGRALLAHGAPKRNENPADGAAIARRRLRLLSYSTARRTAWATAATGAICDRRRRSS